MVLTPTYHVFDLYKAHQDAALLPAAVFADSLPGGVKQITASASVKNGEVTVTLANLHFSEGAEILLDVAGCEQAKAGMRVLAGEPHAHNDFDCPDAVGITASDAIRRTERGLVLTLPACAVAAVTLRA